MRKSAPAMLLLLAACSTSTEPASLADRPEQRIPIISPPADLDPIEPGSGYPKEANVLGRDIRVIQHPSDIDPAVELIPRKPDHLVMRDCRGFTVFTATDNGVAVDAQMVILTWRDVKTTRSRSLTIHAYTPHCRDNPSVQKEFSLA